MLLMFGTGHTSAEFAAPWNVSMAKTVEEFRMHVQLYFAA